MCSPPQTTEVFPLLEITGLRVSYGPAPAVIDASLSVRDHELVVVTGSNGSGKSSLIRSVLGLVAAQAGRIALDGVVASNRRTWHERRRLVAYVPQRTSPGGFPLLVRELLDSSGAPEAAAEVADRLGIGALGERPVTTLSGGQLQRAYLARAVGSLTLGRRLLLADEPTSALDFAGQDDVAELLSSLDVGRLVVSHDAAVVRQADRVLEMAGGVLREQAA